MLHTHAVVIVRVPLSHPVFRAHAAEGMPGSPSVDAVVVEGMADGAKADDPSVAKERHKKHKKHSKKHHKSSKSTHKSSRDADKGHGNGHLDGASPDDAADRESGELQVAPRATEPSVDTAEPVSTPHSAERDQRCVATDCMPCVDVRRGTDSATHTAGL